MRSTPLFLTILVLCVIPTAVAESNPSPGDQATVETTVKPFLKEFCTECHGQEHQKGDRRFDNLSANIHNDGQLVDYQDIVDLLNLGEMPPDDAKQPNDSQRRKVVRVLTRQIDRFHAAHRGSDGDTVLRRLNAREYRNTIRDLLHLDITIFDPTTKFPRDQTTEHLDNVGDTLVTSGHLLARYLDSADTVIEKAIQPLEKPPVKTWTFRDGFRQQPEIDQVHKKTNRFKHMTLYDVVGADKHEGGYGPIHDFAEGVPFDGFYEIRVKAEAVNRLHPYEESFLKRDASEPLRLGIVPGNQEVGNLHLPQPIEPLLAEVELADETKWYTVRVWLDEGFTPRFTFRNGLMDSRSLWGKLIKKYRDQFPKEMDRGIVAARFNAIKHGKLPQIHIHEIEITGPLHTVWPKPSQLAVFGKDWQGDFDESKVPILLKNFASKAYRRSATDDEVDRLMNVFRARKTSGKGAIEAYTDTCKAVLASPNFLYLNEPSRATLSPHALASRLSYFLWSSMPDDELLRLANSGELLRPEILKRQVGRMLKDPKSDALVDGFLGSWLGLRELGATPPDRGDFQDFYQYDLDTAMRHETFLFMRNLIDKDRSIIEFLDSDYTFVNKPLARLYGIKPPDGYEFQKVSLDDSRRGGLLGQASVLTLTANGVDTSPVVRGVWILENILGTPPSPPPPDVEPLDPDTRGAKTIRDQLEKHRNNASCNDCHRKIDPLGFALENYDPIGRWRDKYNSKTMVDSKGELPGGKKFDDIAGLKKILLQQQDQFARAFTTKLLSYAIGRHTAPTDRPHIDGILRSTSGNGFHARSLIQQVVLSEPFMSK